MQLLCTWATPHPLTRELPSRGAIQEAIIFRIPPLTNCCTTPIIHINHQFPGKGGDSLVNLSNLRFDDRAPVYQQIAEYLKRQILLGTVQDGDPMPSRRELAAQTGINPNTAQKAYRLMTEEGYVVTDGNSGSFVRLTPALREQISEELTRGLVEQFVTQAKANRLSYKKVIALVSDLWGDED